MLDSCINGIDSVWKYGLLKKGFGLCHGISGNAYSFLRMFNITKDKKYYQMAIQFSKFITNEENQKKIIFKIDNPISLYEGICGTALFLQDLLHKKSNFPAFDIPEWATDENWIFQFFLKTKNQFWTSQTINNLQTTFKNYQTNE